MTPKWQRRWRMLPLFTTEYHSQHYCHHLWCANCQCSSDCSWGRRSPMRVWIMATLYFKHHRACQGMAPSRVLSFPDPLDKIWSYFSSPWHQGAAFFWTLHWMWTIGRACWGCMPWDGDTRFCFDLILTLLVSSYFEDIEWSNSFDVVGWVHGQISVRSCWLEWFGGIHVAIMDRGWRCASNEQLFMEIGDGVVNKVWYHTYQFFQSRFWWMAV